MSALIKLLPDSIANQIAAGEVIQRPSSVVKELIENAVDAGAKNIHLIFNSAGKTLIKIVDDGSGMQETDLRMSIERHATSKLRTADDLFSIKTMGFRGEALASIAAVAQMSIKSRTADSDAGTELIVEGSKIISQNSCASEVGTTIQVKNLFYNVPARRNFLKSDPVETKHILDEFNRIALANPDVKFKCHHNDKLLYQLDAGNLSQRIVGLFGNNYKERIIPIKEETSIVEVTGFIGKPEFARRTRGEQYFFVNDRFIKDPYLHHAVRNAFEELLPDNCYPSYFIYLNIAPDKIDVNVHPTKTEIKFLDEKSIYAIVRAAVKQALATHNVVPSINFDIEPSFEVPFHQSKETPSQPTINVNENYNPFQDGAELNIAHTAAQAIAHTIKFEDNEVEDSINCMQLNDGYVACAVNGQLFLIDQRRAHKRILFDQILHQLKNDKSSSQQNLFPAQITFNPAEYEMLNSVMPELNALGFDLNEFGSNTFVVHGSPTWLESGNERETLEHIAEQIKSKSSEFNIDRLSFLAELMARSCAITRAKKLNETECVNLVSELFQSSNPSFDSSGKNIVLKLDRNFFEQQFKNKSIHRSSDQSV